MLTLIFAAILVVAVLAHRAGRATIVHPSRLTHALDSRAVLAVVFTVTFVVLRWSWGAWQPLPLVHDEMAYLLQAQIFARGLWALPAQPIPAFWEQPHVLVQPVVAAKYFPGHSLVLAPGVLLGWPALMPLLLHSGSAVLLFLLARRVASGAVALAAWLLWLGTPMVLHFGPTYYSEATTTVCWLAGWYALLEWRAHRRRRWLLAVALCVGWCFLTRPLTGVAYAIPVAIVVLRDVIALARWRDLIAALALGSAVLAIIPLWSARTTGDWRLTPLMLYTRQYMPDDVPGFGTITTAPELELSPELARLHAGFQWWHRDHRPSRLPQILLNRWRALAVTIWGVSHGVLMLFALLGLLTLDGAAAFAVCSSVLLLLLYLLHAIPSVWTLYYFETVPVAAYLTAAGLAWAAAMIGRPRGGAATRDFGWRAPRWSVPLVAGALALCLPSVVALRMIRDDNIRARRPIESMAALRDAIPDRTALLFVHYAPRHDPNVALVQNVVDPGSAHVWVVRDRGGRENARLIALAPERRAYIYDEAQQKVFLYDPARAP
jgi:hypothetical protein